MDKVKTGFAVSLLGCSHLTLIAFWCTLITGFFYYSWIGEGDWKCYATQDDSVLVPWDTQTQGDAPDGYHNVSKNFIVVCFWGFFDYTIILVYWLLAVCN